MEPISTFLLTAAGFVLKGALQSKAADTAKEELLGGFWKWVKGFFVKDVPELEQQPDSPEAEAKTQERLLELIKDESFFNELVQRVGQLQQSGIREKNILRKNIERVKKIRIGDKELSSDNSYSHINIVGGVKDADEFILGDGH